jgi:hypothetical protein
MIAKVPSFTIATLDHPNKFSYLNGEANDGERTHSRSLMSRDTFESTNFESPMDRALKTYSYDPNLPMPKGSQIEIYTPEHAEPFPITLLAKKTHFVPVRQKKTMKEETITAGIGLYPRLRNSSDVLQLKARKISGIKGGMPLSAVSYINGDPNRPCYHNDDYPNTPWSYDGSWHADRPEGELLNEPVTSANTQENTRSRRHGHRHRHRNRHTEDTTREYQAQPEMGMNNQPVELPPNYQPSGIPSAAPERYDSSQDPAPATESSTAYNAQPQYTAQPNWIAQQRVPPRPDWMLQQQQAIHARPVPPALPPRPDWMLQQQQQAIHARPVPVPPQYMPQEQAPQARPLPPPQPQSSSTQPVSSNPWSHPNYQPFAPEGVDLAIGPPLRGQTVEGSRRFNDAVTAVRCLRNSAEAHPGASGALINFNSILLQPRAITTQSQRIAAVQALLRSVENTTENVTAANIIISHIQQEGAVAVIFPEFAQRNSRRTGL